MKFVILTGMSGAGKSTAIKMMEDIGFYCVDNLPIPLLEKFVELTTLQSAELQKVAVGIDIRSGQSFDELHGVLDHMKDNGVYCVDNLPIPLLEKFVELTTLQIGRAHV